MIMTIQAGDFSLGAVPAGLEGSFPGIKGSQLPERQRPGVPPASPPTPHGDTGEDPDVALYLRHVEGGETIRSLARELGCHASTVMRRIRRFEARRDDPLVDSAVERVAASSQSRADKQPAASAPGPIGMKQIARILRRLAEPGAQLVVGDGMEKAIVIRDDIRTAILDRQLAEHMAVRSWVQLSGQGRLARYVISMAGREALRAMIAGRKGSGVPQGEDFVVAAPVLDRPDGCAEEGVAFDHANGPREWGEAEIVDPEDGQRKRARVNLAESPLMMLARRREADGRPFLAPELVAAGERLREDFELAQMGPRLAQNWDRFLTAGIDVSRSGPGYCGGSEGARDRVAAALRELGPGLGDMCLRVCCFLEGIEMTERRLGWSARSGKIVLRLALMRLDIHYRETYGSGAPLIG
ncbi:DUF6456 domain-containing protein [Paracoccus sp. MBLB3053]|uniref:DUF6456 domain-containing protein n=1 Tax=Paracoccus aurantius TaxID=3073814 RepID=A0ABU2HTY4_9RHOB|nr:DUF6456 domain-containing protein [Paracoccus sp. MBLB3053]MDS9468506.1 DUF6456 domain-containing protein [Paracoccus sp. MBLB3053]